ncbi:MAG: cation-translocating P-type ATPase [Coriobacteriia bacterium]|nr:cation-translocating P-type ATPase [Coriobacteriia bacterium]
MNFYTNELDDIYHELNSSNVGLSSKEAQNRLERYGNNKLKRQKSTPIFTRFLRQFCDPMIIILLAAAVVSGVLSYVQGESYADVIIILIVVIANAVLGVYQESKAEAAIDALNDLSKSKSRVYRDGKLCEILSDDIVVGDVVMLEAGDAVPADGRLIEASTLKIEESVLTGESVPVDKLISVLNMKKVPLADRVNMVYMGTSVAYGRAAFIVTATGMDTEMGKIAGALSDTKENKTPLQIKMAQLSKLLTWLVLAICIIVFAVQLVRAGSFDFQYIINSFMIAVSLAVAAIPEGLPAVVTVVLSIGVTNMSKRNAIIRKLTAVETLGCAQIVCTDKTGTLTQNKMSVVEHFGDELMLKKAVGLCNDAEGEVGEPTELGLYQWSMFNKDSCPRIDEKPFDSDRKMMSTLHKDGNKTIQFTKGAPDVVLNLCSNVDKKKVLNANKAMADKALRVLACAYREGDKIVESDMTFIGLVGMIDPIRPEAKKAIIECKEAGITPIMITGDHIDTAVAIAHELGIEGRALSGIEINDLTDEELLDVAIYARVQPEHKTRIVKAWQDSGHIVAMTGDGVNDAPSIKTADIGVGMGITGTDVTKNVADMVLSDDNFATIVGAVEEGRRIYDNIRRAIQFLLASNLAEVVAVFVASLFGFLILKPVHLLWINLITDSFPAFALGTEHGEPNIMKRKPRDTKDGIFAGGMAFDIMYQGLMVTILVLISYYIGFNHEGASNGITMAFITMSLAEIFHSFNMRSQRQSIFKLGHHNKLLWIAAIISVITTTAVCEIPFLANAFDFARLELYEYAIALGIAFLVIPIVEIVKLIQRTIEKKHLR